MATIEFASSIARHTETAVTTFPGSTVRELLDAVFKEHAQLRGYVLDDQGAVRKHVTIFINDQTIRDRDLQSDPIRESDRVYVFQALSGG